MNQALLCGRVAFATLTIVVAWGIEASAQGVLLEGFSPIHPSLTVLLPPKYHYEGSPVKKYGASEIASVSVQGLYCGIGWTSGTAQANQLQLEKFLPSIVGSSFMSALSVYGCNTGTATEGLVLDFKHLPHWTDSNPVFLDDSVIQSWLKTRVSSGVLSSKNAYVMYIEPQVAIKMSDGATSTSKFLGYHGSTSAMDANGNHVTIPYMVVAYPGAPNFTSNSQYFSNDFDQLTAVTSHELAECVTDFVPGKGWVETVKELNAKGKVINTFHEEIGDIPLMLYSHTECYCRLNGYLVQKCIAADGVSLLTYQGSTPPNTIYSSAVSLINEKLAILGIKERAR